MRANGNVMLAVDTSTRTVGLALYDGAQVLSEATWTSSDYHTVELAPAIAEALQKTGRAVADLAALAAAIGPGSFTGVRVGLALVKGLAVARKLPLIGVPTLDFLAAAQALPAGPDESMAAVLRAGRGRLAVHWYRADGEVWQPQPPLEVLTLPELAHKIVVSTRVCGELDAEERQALPNLAPLAHLAGPAACLRRPGFLAELAWKRWKAGLVDDPAELAPVYLHYNDPIPV